MPKLLTYALPITVALFLLVFYAGLPLLNRCQLPQRRPGRFDRFDALLLGLITALYAIPAFWSLGNTVSPETFFPLEGQTVTLTLDEPTRPESAMIFAGIGIGGYEMQVSFDGEDYITVHTIDQGSASVLKWERYALFDVDRPIVSLRLHCTYGQPWLGEVVLYDEAGQVIPLRCEESALCDEPDTAPEKQHFMNSTYFDEIYHARTAWEHLHNVWPYEISHPPLGKEILSLGILLFGMTPFGWRFSGTLTGVLMLPLMYLLLKRLFGGRAVPALGTVVFAADFMHYVQTRIATIDSYGVFFILLMFYFMYLWLEEEKPWQLALCGVSFGLGAASKWICLYAGAGLGVLWAAYWIRRFVGKKGKKTALFRTFLWNVCFCLVFFILVPCGVYYLAYLPYGRALGQSPFSLAYLQTIVENQRFMFTYHASIVAEHPYSSRWYQWLLNIRPILYYLEYYDDGTRSSIAAFVNPLLCWGGLLSLFVLGYTAIFRRDRRAAFLLVGFLAQLLPWVFISRLTFAYHYFPSAAFLVLSMGYIFALTRENNRRWLLYAGSFTVVCVVLFVLFFPVLSGMPADNVRTTQILQWLPTWPI